MTKFDIIVFPFGFIGVEAKMILVCHPKYHPLPDYHQFTTRMIKSIYVFRSMDRVYLFSRLELTINWIAFSIEFIYCTDKGAAYGKKLLKTLLISVRCRTRSLPFKIFKSLLEKKKKKNLHFNEQRFNRLGAQCTDHWTEQK